MANEAKRAGVVPRRIHLVVAIDRLLARLLVSAPAGSWVVKGGFANQLRRPGDARFTEDVDLRVDSTIERANDLMAAAFATDLDDLFAYEAPVAATSLGGPPGGGRQFVVVARLAGTELVRFKADVSAGDAIVGDTEEHPSDPILERLGYAPARFPVYPLGQSVAEKIHALTLPRSAANTRARDLVDLVWFAQRFGFRSDDLIDAGRVTFDRRLTHAWPPEVPRVPPTWTTAY